MWRKWCDDMDLKNWSWREEVMAFSWFMVAACLFMASVGARIWISHFLRELFFHSSP